MDKQFKKPSVIKTTTRKYFSGNKKLKNIKMFEEFSLNEAQVDAVAARKLSMSKKFKDDVALMVEMSKKYKKMEASLKSLGKILGEKETSVQKTLEEFGAVFVDLDTAVGKVALSIKTKEGKETKSYQGIATELEAMIPKTKKVVEQIETIYNKYTKHNPEKKELEYKVQEGFMDFIKSVGSWIKSAFDKLKSMLPDFKKSTKKFTAAVDAAIK